MKVLKAQVNFHFNIIYGAGRIKVFLKVLRLWILLKARKLDKKLRQIVYPGLEWFLNFEVCSETFPVKLETIVKKAKSLHLFKT